MSEPTPEQIEAGERHYSDWGGGLPPAGKVAAIYTAMRALERPSDEAVERSELLELLELGGDYAADTFNDFRDKTSECALRVKADIERFNKAHAAIAAMPEQSK